jgi:peptidyl-prolyl cis-trans isomerase D
MLRTLRRNMRGILWVTIAMVIPSFLIFYGYRRIHGTPAQQFAGEIYGRKIPLRKYRESLHWTRTMALMRYGSRFKEIEKFLNLEQEAWQNLVLLEYAGLKGLTVTDYELISLIKSFPAFHKDGGFDTDTYQRTLQYAFGITPDYFESGIKNSLYISKLKDTITDGVKVTDQELRQYHRYMNEKVRAKYILFASSDFLKEANVTEQQIKDYFNSHRNEFREPEKVKLEYVFFQPKPKSTRVNEAEIEHYYLRNSNRFKDPKDENKILPVEKVRDEIAQELRIRKAREKTEEEGEALLSLLEEGMKNWNELNVTQTDFLEKNVRVEGLPSACIEAAFPLETGEISDLVQTENGFFIIKLISRRSSRLPTDYRQAAGRVEEKVRQIEAEKLTQSRAEKCLVRLKEEKNIAAVAREYSKQAVDTGFFTRPGYIESLGIAPEFRRTAFSLTKSNPFASAPVTSGFCVLAFEERESPDKDDFEKEKEKEKLITILLAEKKQNILRDSFRLLEEEGHVSLHTQIRP